MSNRRHSGKLGTKLLICAIVALYAVSLVKRIFVGYDIDEQYSVTLLYRVAAGDIPVKELWEPHQTSALIFAPLVRAFMAVRGNTEYLMVFLRAVGGVLQALTALLWYKAVSVKTRPWIAAFSAGMILFVLPKWIQSPEFTNMQIWMLIATCVVLILAIEKDSFALAVVSGAFFTLEVLSYPSCVLLLIVFAILLRKDLKKFGGMMIVPLVSFAAFVTYLLFNMSLEEIKYGISHILSDGSHSDGFHDKLLKYISELPQLAVHVLIYLAIGVAVSLLWRILARKKSGNVNIVAVALCVCSTVALLDQFRFWFSDGAHIGHPQYGYFVLFCSGLAFYFMNRKDFAEKWNLWAKVMYGASFAGFIAVLMLTNLDIRASFVHLLPGMIMSVILFADWCGKTAEESAARVAVQYLLAGVCALLLFGQLFVVRTSNEGRYEDIRLVRQKSLYAASKGIYCAYMEGFESNDNYLLLKANIPDGSKVLYVGPDNLLYLMGSYVVCEPNTISTPVYVGLADYYGANPDRRPEYVVFEKSYVDFKGISEREILEDSTGGAVTEELCESDFIKIIRVVR